MIALIQLYKKSFSGLSREVWLIAIVMLINRIGTMVLPFLTLYATESLGFSLIRAGIAASFFGLGSLAGAYLGGWLTDRIGFIKVMVWSLILSGIGFVSLIYISNFYAFCISIFIVSTIADALRPATMAGIGQHTDPETQTRGISLMRLAFNLGISIGPALGGLVAGIYGFHWLFILEGLTCILAGISFYWLMRNRGVKKIDKEAIIKEEEVQSAYKDYRFIFYLFVCLVNLIAFMQILSTVPLYFREIYHLNEAQIGLFFTINGLLIFIFEMPMVYVIERKFKLMKPIMIGAFMMALAHLIFPALPGMMWAIIIYTFMITFGEIINFPFITSLSLKRSPEKNRGQYMGLVAMMFSLSFIFAPIIGTALVDSFGFNLMWVVMGCFNLLAIIGYYLVQHEMDPSIALENK